MKLAIILFCCCLAVQAVAQGPPAVGPPIKFSPEVEAFLTAEVDRIVEAEAKVERWAGLILATVGMFWGSWVLHTVLQRLRL